MSREAALEGSASTKGSYLRAATAGFDAAAFLRTGMVLALGQGMVAVGTGLLERRDSPPSNGIAFYAPDFYLTDATPWWVPEFYEEMPARELGTRLSAVTQADRSPARIAWRGGNSEQFQQRVRDILRSIESGEIRKAVPVDVLQGELISSRADADDASSHLGGELRSRLQKALVQQRGLRCYGLWHEDEGILGATPELLFSFDGASLRTVALAGTRRVSPGLDHEQLDALKQELASDDKEQREHQLVVEDIFAQLSRLGAVEIGNTGILELPGLLHLETALDLHAHARPLEFTALVRCLHPTPALGISAQVSRAGQDANDQRVGTDREFALRWLHERDDAELRGRLGAPFGLLRRDGSGVCVVAIRNVQWRGCNVRLGAGCGVVSGSDPEREWIELTAKRSAVRSLLGL